MSSNPTAGRRTTLSLAGLIAVASATLVLAVSGAHEGHADTGHGHADAVAVSATTTAKQAEFREPQRSWPPNTLAGRPSRPRRMPSPVWR